MTHILKTIIPLAFIFAFLVATNFLYAAWTAPTAAAPGDNAPAPINVGSATQQKYGDLGVFKLITGEVVTAQYCNQDGTICKTLEEILSGAAAGGGGESSAFLVNNQHTEAQCASLSGVLETQLGATFCKFTTASCPAGWALYNGWNQTAARSCTGVQGFGCSASPCNTGAHAWKQNGGVETCTYSNFDRQQSDQCLYTSATCLAYVTATGCY